MDDGEIAVELDTLADAAKGHGEANLRVAFLVVAGLLVPLVALVVFVEVPSALVSLLVLSVFGPYWLLAMPLSKLLDDNVRPFPSQARLTALEREDRARDPIAGQQPRPRYNRHRDRRSAAAARRRRLSAREDLRRTPPHGAPAGDWRAALRRDGGGLCWYCNARLDRKWHVEHVVPLYLTEERGHTWLNIRPSCRSCNMAKGTTHPCSWVRGNAPHRLAEVRSIVRKLQARGIPVT